MTTIYTDQCPFCGTYINIKNAIVCPGCSNSIFYGPEQDWWSGSRYYYYYADRQSRDEAIRKKKAYEEFWASEAGIRIIEQKESERKRKKIRKSIFAFLGYLNFFSIPVVWLLYGSKWKTFGWYGWPVLILSILFIFEKKGAKGDIASFICISITVVWLLGGWKWNNFGMFGWPALGLSILLGWLHLSEYEPP
jgi:hypothetical protein